MSEFWAGLSGVIVGAVLSLVVSLVVARRAVVREMRVRIYEDLLPPLTMMLRDTDVPMLLPTYAEQGRKFLEPITRAGHVAGGTDARKVDDLNSALGRWEDLLPKTRTQFDEDSGRTIPAFDDEVTETEYASVVDGFKQAVKTYREWLRKRLSGWL